MKKNNSTSLQQRKKWNKTRLKSAVFRVQLLSCVKKGFYPSQIARYLKVSRHKVHYHIKALEKTGMVIRKAKTRPVFYILGPGVTQKVEKITQAKLDKFMLKTSSVEKKLIGYEKTIDEAMGFFEDILKPKLRVNAHGCKLRCNVTKGSLPLIPKTYDMQNWKRSNTEVYLEGYGHIKVFFNHTKQPNVIIQPPEIWGTSAIENQARYLMIAERVKNVLMQKILGLELSQPYIVKGHHQVEIPGVSEAIKKEKMTSGNEKGWADTSPKPGGLESEDPVTVDEILKMPEKLDKLEAKVDSLENSVSKLVSILEKLAPDSPPQQIPAIAQPPGGMYG